jgi:phosphatidylserine/phosphatidylglycerophosphate/cardiolipin synthase-like enzyme
VLECHFFPNPSNEPKIVNLIRKAKISLYVAIFALTNDRLYAAIEEVFNRGVPVKIIADDEMAKCMGSDVYRAAALVDFT